VALYSVKPVGDDFTNFANYVLTETYVSEEAMFPAVMWAREPSPTPTPQIVQQVYTGNSTIAKISDIGCEVSTNDRKELILCLR